MATPKKPKSTKHAKEDKKKEENREQKDIDISKIVCICKGKHPKDIDSMTNMECPCKALKESIEKEEVTSLHSEDFDTDLDDQGKSATSKT